MYATIAALGDKRHDSVERAIRPHGPINHRNSETRCQARHGRYHYDIFLLNYLSDYLMNSNPTDTLDDASDNPPAATRYSVTRLQKSTVVANFHSVKKARCT